MLPDLLPDMTLYSLCALAHRMSDNTSAMQTSNELFGNPRAGLLQDFPYALSAFCDRTHNAYGSPNEVARNMTNIPYFTRFRPAAIAAKLQQMLAGNTASRFKLSLGLHSSPIGAKFPLRACNKCVEEDVRSHGVAYWHRRHQLPGTWVCPQHGVVLDHSMYRLDRRKKTCYILPSDQEVLAIGVHDSFSDTALPSLYRLAELSATILDTPLPVSYTAERLRNTYLHGLKAQGLLTRQGRVRVQELIQRLRERFANIATLPPFDWILSPAHIDGFARLVRQPRSDIHTTYHVLMVDTLFGDWTAFVSVYEWEASLLPQLDDISVNCEVGSRERYDPLLLTIAESARVNRLSLSAACRDAGFGYQTVLRNLAATGTLDVLRRPRVLTHELRASVVGALGSGLDQREVARMYGLSRSTIDRVCVETPGLHAEWQRARFLRRRDFERKKMQSFLADNPCTGRAEARAIGDNGYSWLRRHDADWLRSTVAAKVPIRSKAQRRRERVAWQARDIECLMALEKLAGGVSFVRGDRRTTGALMRKLPRLSFAPRLERLPKAKAYAEHLAK